MLRQNNNKGKTLKRQLTAGIAGMLAYLLLAALTSPVLAAEVTIDAPKVLLTNVGFDVSVDGLDPGIPAELRINGAVVASGTGPALVATAVEVPKTGTSTLEIRQNGATLVQQQVPVIPAAVSILPPLIAILLAFLVRSVIPALFVGLVVGAWAINGMTWYGGVHGFLRNRHDLYC